MNSKINQIIVLALIVFSMGEQSVLSSENQRFIDKGDGTVSDNNTGVIWQKDGMSEKMNWAEALEYCADLTLGGKDIWRVPNIKELRSIVDVSRTGPAIDDTVFPLISSEHYWSSTSALDRKAWMVYFYDGSAIQKDRRGDYKVLCIH